MAQPLGDLDPAELSRLQSGIRIMALCALRDGDAADDVAQESLARVLQALREGRLRNPERLGAFARAIAHHVIVDTLRTRLRVTSLGSSPELAGEEDALRTLVSAEQAARVRAALERLSAGDREILRLSFFEGLTPQELATRSGAPSARIRKRKERALERLRAVFLGSTRHETGPSPTQLVEAQPAMTRPGTSE